jgi:hypothetical protein
MLNHPAETGGGRWHHGLVMDIALQHDDDFVKYGIKLTQDEMTTEQ